MSEEVDKVEESIEKCEGCEKILSQYAWIFSQIDKNNSIMCPICHKRYDSHPSWPKPPN